MPADLLLPAFALALVANAVIIAVAIRALRDGGAEPRDRSAPVVPAPAEATRPTIATSPGPLVTSAPETPTAAITAPVDDVAPADHRPVGEPIARTRARPKPAAARESAVAGRPGRRRKFSLPPLDEDHEKVSRSIETFLGVTDEVPTPVQGSAAAAAVGGEPAAAAATPIAPHAVVTVAVIQLEGPGARDVLERTVRSTARAADQVTIDRRGRVRVVLPETGEVAAKAYLRRIRAIVEPIAEATEPPSRIVIATATEIDGSVVAARRRADRRLAVALGQGVASAEVEALGEDDADDIPEPRAAGR